jgi:adenosine kinase
VQDGVKVLYQRNPTVPTGTCAVLINKGERSLVANLAAANTFSAAHLELEESKAAVALAKVFYISGFFLTVSLEAILSIAQHSLEASKTFAVNLSAPFLIQFFGDQLSAVLPFTDFVFGNESEAATFGQVRGLGEDLPTIALRLAALPKASGTKPRVVVFTQGSQGTIGNSPPFPPSPPSVYLLSVCTVPVG